MVEWRRSTCVLVRMTPRGVLLLGEDDTEVILVPGAGPALWHVLAEPSEEAAVVAAIADVFDTDPVSISGDIATLLGDLERRGLVRSR